MGRCGCRGFLPFLGLLLPCPLPSPLCVSLLLSSPCFSSSPSRLCPPLPSLPPSSRLPPSGPRSLWSPVFLLPFSSPPLPPPPPPLPRSAGRPIPVSSSPASFLYLPNSSLSSNTPSLLACLHSPISLPARCVRSSVCTALDCTQDHSRSTPPRAANPDRPRVAATLSRWGHRLAGAPWLRLTPPSSSRHATRARAPPPTQTAEIAGPQRSRRQVGGRLPPVCDWGTRPQATACHRCWTRNPDPPSTRPRTDQHSTIRPTARLLSSPLPAHRPDS